MISKVIPCRRWLHLINQLTLLILILLCQPVNANIAILIHGYTGNAGSWEYSGINDLLEQNGWQRAGILTNAAAGVDLLPAGRKLERKNFVYNVNLPSEAPLLIQAQHLNSLLSWVNSSYPDEKIILVAHSAGGLVSRLVMLGPLAGNVSGLITIASPHLGTYRAGQALDAVESKPFFCPGPGWDIMKSFFGGSEYDLVRRSEPLLAELLPSHPGSLIYWLNRQTHPDVAYYSIARGNYYLNGDELVPGYSQDMNNVPALKGRTILYVTSAGHALVPADGQLISQILNNWK